MAEKQSNRYLYAVLAIFALLFFAGAVFADYPNCPNTDGVVSISTNTTWANADYACDTIAVTNNSTLTIDSATAGGMIDITANSFTVDSGSTVSGNLKGYAKDLGPGAGTTSTTSRHGSGGAGYGGYGGIGGTGKAGGAVYEDINYPADMGSGGGSGSVGYGGAGGGGLKLIIAGALTVNGTVSMNGGNGSVSGSDWAGGGGSGGAINISASTFTGSGLLEVKGGNGSDSYYTEGGGGAGGRIAVELDTNSFTGTFDVNGGSGPSLAWDGGCGTIFLKDSVYSDGNLYVECNSTYYAGGAVIDENVWFDNVIVRNNSSMEFSPDADKNVVFLHADNVYIEAGSNIDSSGRGFGSASGPGKGTNSTASRGGSGGGSYGGRGGTSNYGYHSDYSYDSIKTPTMSGSGGGAGTAVGGAGGGAIGFAVSNEFELNGLLKTHGSNGGVSGSDWAGGGGSGGLIRIHAGTFSGAGDLDVSGGHGGDAYYAKGGGGAGGRIAIDSTTFTYSGTYDITGGEGSAGSRQGGCGTILLKDSANPDGNLYSNCFMSDGLYDDSVLYYDETFSNIVVDSNGNIAFDPRPNDLNNVTVTVAKNVEVEEGSMITSYGKGYSQNTGPEKGTTCSASKSAGGGAGHGGWGAVSSWGTASGYNYDNPFYPTEKGSGGGNCGSSTGGSGGGVVKIVAYGTIDLNGTIHANGEPGSAYNSDYVAGGGSGGTINITVNEFSGTGLIQSIGGTGADSSNYGDGGGGSGGMIMIDANTHSFSGTFDLAGGLRGNTGYYGGCGSVVLKDQAYPDGNLVADCPSSYSTQSRGPVLDQNYSCNTVLVSDEGILTFDSRNEPIQLNADNFFVDENGIVSGYGMGYSGSEGPGAGTDQTSSNRGAGGGGHGAHGGRGSNEAGGLAYGILMNSLERGSGGGNGHIYMAGGAGGGAIKLIAVQTILLNGTIDVNGVPGSNYNSNWGSAGGSGGSVYLQADVFAGTGSLDVKGGDGVDGYYYDSGGGSGGRVTLDLNDFDFSGLLSLEGGSSVASAQDGGCGSLARKDSDYPDGNLIAQCRMNDSAGDFIIDANIAVDSIIVKDSGRLTIDSSLNDEVLELLADNIEVEAGSTISAYAKGYSGSEGPGAGTDQTLSKQGASGGAYGSHGGRGSTHAGPLAYGSLINSMLIGSGGGNGHIYMAGGAGGGAIKLIAVQTILLNGTIDVNGAPGSNYNTDWGSAGGSGGSVYLQADVFAGTGSLDVKGGDGVDGYYYDSGGGSGGRVTLDLNDFDFSGLLSLEGGSSVASAQDGGCGSLARKDSDYPDGNLIAQCRMTDSLADFVIDHNIAADNIIVRDGGRMHLDSSRNSAPVKITVDNLYIDENSSITGRGKGFGGQEGLGAGGQGAYRNGAGGGAYGGTAGNGEEGVSGGQAYGEFVKSLIMGSGGGSGYSGETCLVLGGSGGASAEFVVSGLLDLNGAIDVNGIAGGDYTGNYASGGGSGGSLIFNVNRMTGTGAVFLTGAQGGQCPYAYCDGGGGSGGRLTIETEHYDFSGNLSVLGGTGTGNARNGSCGSIAFVDSLYPDGNLYANCNSGDGSGDSVIVSDKTFSAIHVVDGGRIDIVCRDNLVPVTLTADQIFVDAGGTIEGIADGYSGGEGPGQGEDIYTSSTTVGSGGAGYGGAGGAANSAGGTTYNDENNALALGSGSGKIYVNGTLYIRGAYGGAGLKLVAREVLNVDGNIDVSGENGWQGSWYLVAGGGSGGGLELASNVFSGAGDLIANGGLGKTSSYSYAKAGGGGGGRIKASYKTNNFTGHIYVDGGSSTVNVGQPGTSTLRLASFFINVTEPLGGTYLTGTENISFDYWDVSNAPLDCTIYYSDNPGDADTLIEIIDTSVDCSGGSTGSCTVQWDTNAVPVGDYYIDVLCQNQASALESVSSSQFSLESYLVLEVLYPDNNVTVTGFDVDGNFRYRTNWPDSLTAEYFASSVAGDFDSNVGTALLADICVDEDSDPQTWNICSYDWNSEQFANLNYYFDVNVFHSPFGNNDNNFASGETGFWTSNNPVSSPVQIYPDNNSITSDSAPAFYWEEIEAAVEYRLYIDDDPAFGSSWISDALTDLNYVLTSTLTDNDYYWKVRAFSVYGNWGDSTSRHFEVDSSSGPAQVAYPREFNFAGDYVLINDFTDLNETAFEINSSNLTIDGNGMTISSNSGSETAVSIDSAVTGIEITDFNIYNMEYGVYGYAASGTISDVNVFNNTIENTTNGIYFGGTNATTLTDINVMNNTVKGGSYCFRTYDGNPSEYNIQENHFENCGVVQAVPWGSYAVIDFNIYDNNFFGINMFEFTSGTNGIRIKDNNIYNFSSTKSLFDFTNGYHSQMMQNIIINGNEISGGTSADYLLGNDFKAYNNSFVNNIVLNNTFTDGMFYWDEWAGGYDADYNYNLYGNYFNGNSSPSIVQMSVHCYDCNFQDNVWENHSLSNQAFFAQGVESWGTGVGGTITDSFVNFDSNNFINGKRLRTYINQSNVAIDSGNPHQVILLENVNGLVIDDQEVELLGVRDVSNATITDVNINRAYQSGLYFQGNVQDVLVTDLNTKDNMFREGKNMFAPAGAAVYIESDYSFDDNVYITNSQFNSYRYWDDSYGSGGSLILEENGGIKDNNQFLHVVDCNFIHGSSSEAIQAGNIELNNIHATRWTGHATENFFEITHPGTVIVKDSNFYSLQQLSGHAVINVASSAAGNYHFSNNHYQANNGSYIIYIGSNRAGADVNIYDQNFYDNVSTGKVLLHVADSTDDWNLSVLRNTFEDSATNWGIDFGECSVDSNCYWRDNVLTFDNDRAVKYYVSRENDLDLTNTVNLNPIVHYEHVDGLVIDSSVDASMIHLYDVNNVLISDQNIVDAHYGLVFDVSSGFDVSDVHVEGAKQNNDGVGMYFYYVDDGAVHDSFFVDDYYLFRFGDYSTDINFHRNNVSSINTAFWYETANNSSLAFDNNIDIYTNAVSGTPSTGTDFNVAEDCSGRNVINGPCIAGNFWSGYGGSDADEDGIGDTALQLNFSGNIRYDYKPLTELVSIDVVVTDPNAGELVSGVYAIDFNFTDNYDKPCEAAIYYSSVQGAKEILIVEGLNLEDPGVCVDLDNDNNTENECSYAWTLADGLTGTYYIDVDVNNDLVLGADSSDLPSILEFPSTAKKSSGEEAEEEEETVDLYLNNVSINSFNYITDGLLKFFATNLGNSETGLFRSVVYECDGQKGKPYFDRRCDGLPGAEEGYNSTQFVAMLSKAMIGKDLYVKLDADNSVDEESESNNAAKIKIECAERGLPDLHIDSIVGTPEKNTLILNAAIGNIGEEKSPQTKAVLYEYRNNKYEFVYTADVPAISPGKNSMVLFRIDLQESGTKKYKVAVNVGNEFEEEFRENNSKEFETYFEFQKMMPDLELSEIKAVSEIIELDDSVALRAVVKNVGDIIACDYNVAFYQGDPSNGGERIRLIEVECGEEEKTEWDLDLFGFNVVDLRDRAVSDSTMSLEKIEKVREETDSISLFVDYLIEREKDEFEVADALQDLRNSVSRMSVDSEAAFRRIDAIVQVLEEKDRLTPEKRVEFDYLKDDLRVLSERIHGLSGETEIRFDEVEADESFSEEIFVVVDPENNVEESNEENNQSSLELSGGDEMVIGADFVPLPNPEFNDFTLAYSEGSLKHFNLGLSNISVGPMSAFNLVFYFGTFICPYEEALFADEDVNTEEKSCFDGKKVKSIYVSGMSGFSSHLFDFSLVLDSGRGTLVGVIEPIDLEIYFGDRICTMEFVDDESIYLLDEEELEEEEYTETEIPSDVIEQTEAEIQEFYSDIFENTDVSFEDEVEVGNEQDLNVYNENTFEGIEATVELTDPSENLRTYRTDAGGEVSFAITETGIHKVKIVVRGTVVKEFEFTGIAVTGTLFNFIGQGLVSVFGAEAMKAPLLVALAILLGAAAAYYFSRKGKKILYSNELVSSKMENMQNLAVMGISGVMFVAVIISVRLVNTALAGIAVAIVLMIGTYLLMYLRKRKGRKVEAVKV